MARMQKVAVPLAESLAKAISIGTYPIGTALPTLSQIERSEGCSRSTVQRALTILADRGLVQGRQGAGIFVCGVPAVAPEAAAFEIAEAGHVGRLYVIQFASNVVKVGFTTDPHVRIRTLGSEARKRFDSISRSWTSQPHPRASQLEAGLLTFARQRYKTAFGDEYFRDADFDALVDHVRTLLSEERPLDLFDFLAA